MGKNGAEVKKILANNISLAAQVKIVCDSDEDELPSKPTNSNSANDRDLNPTGKIAQAGNYLGNNIGLVYTQINHRQASEINLITNGFGTILSFFTVAYFKLLHPLYKRIRQGFRRGLGYTDEVIDENKELENIASGNLWHRSFRTAALIGINAFMIIGAIIWSSLHNNPLIEIDFFKHLGSLGSMLVTGVVGGIISGIVVAYFQQHIDQHTAKINKRNLKKTLIVEDVNVPKVDSWSRRAKAGVFVGNQFGLLCGLLLSHFAPVIPLPPMVLMALTSAAAGLIGGLVAILVGPAIDKYAQQLSRWWLFRKLYEMADGEQTNNPPSNRIKLGLTAGMYIGTLIGAALGTFALPVLGTTFGALLGGAVGSLVGSVAGFLIEPIINYLKKIPFFKDNFLSENRTANPWSGRTRIGMVFGATIGLAIGTLIAPGVGTIIGPAIGGLLGGALFLVAEPIYAHIQIFLTGESIKADPNVLQDKTGNPWSARLAMASSAGAVIGSVIALCVIGPFTGFIPAIAIGALIGVVVGGGIGLALTESRRNYLKQKVEPIYEKIAQTLETGAEKISALFKPKNEIPEIFESLRSNTSIAGQRRRKIVEVNDPVAGSVTPPISSPLVYKIKVENFETKNSENTATWERLRTKSNSFNSNKKSSEIETMFYTVS